MSIKKKQACLLFVFAASLMAVLWTLSIYNTLVFDDSTILSHVSLSSYDSLFSFYPASVYLDRPIRDILLKLLFDLFGSDYALLHAALVFTHLANVLLAFLTARRLFALKRDLPAERAFVGACIAAAIFGAWPNSLMAVQWVSGNNDMMGATFALLSVLFYLRSIQESEYKGQNTFLTLLFYYFAIRSKEMFYPLPLIFVLCEVYRMIQEKKKSRLSRGCVFSLAVMLLFLAGIFYYKLKDHGMTVDPTGPYYQSFNPVSMLAVLMKYCSMYFDLSNGGFVYLPSTDGAVGCAVTALGLVVAIVLAVKGKPGFLFGYLAIGLSIVMVLPMVNQIHRLYLYFPAFFVGFVVACAVIALPRHHEKVLALICLGCVFASQASGPQFMHESWFSYGRMENRAYQQLEAIDPPAKGSHIYIRLEDMDDYTPFYYGPGSVIKLVFQDDTLVSSLHTLDEAIDYQSPYLVLQYVNGQVSVAERDHTRTLSILSVSPYPQPDGSLVLGISPDKVSDSLIVLVDGQALRTFINTDFISATVPASLLTDKSSVQITIRDGYGVVSDPWEIALP